MEELRVYDIGFWQSLGRTSGTAGLGATYSIEVDGAVVAQKSPESLSPGNDPSSFRHESALYTTSAGQTSATVTFRLSGGGTGTFGMSYDDFHFDVTPACGDGLLNSVEECDDGNRADGDCCSAGCQVTNDALPCDDGLQCTDGDTCGGGICDGTQRICNDDNLCTVDYCSEYTVGPTCLYSRQPVPDAYCFTAGKAKLEITDSAVSDEDELSWKWSTGQAFDQADVATPLAETTYALCAYDTQYSPYNGSEDVLKLSVQIPASATLWKDRNPRGALYIDRTGTTGGIQRLRLKTGIDGRTSLKLSASGTNLPLPGPYYQTPDFGIYFAMLFDELIIQLVNSHGACWSTTFGSEDMSENSGEGFSAHFR